MPKPVTLSSDFQTFLDACPAPMLLFEVKGFRILAANDAAVQSHGYSKAEFAARTIMDLRPAYDVARITKLASRFLDTPDAAGRSVHLTRDGAEIVFDVRTQVIHVDGQLCKLAVLHDVTRQVRQEEAVQAQMAQAAARERGATALARRFAELVNLAPGRFVILSPEDLEVVAVSDGYLAVTGAAREDVIGLPLFAEAASTDGVLLSSLRRVTQTGAQDLLRQVALPFAKAGTTLWAAVNIPLKAPDGAVVFILHSLIDRVKGDASPADDTVPTAVAPAAITLEALEKLEAALRAQDLARLSQRLSDREAVLRATGRLLNVHEWRFDIETGQLEWVNEVFCLFGLPVSTKAPDFDAYVAMVHPDDRAQMVDNFHQFFESTAHEFFFAHRIVRPDGTIVHLRGGAEKICDDGRAMLNGVVQDVTPEREAAAEAERRDYLLRIAGELGGIGGWRVDLARKLCEWSPETAQIHELPGTSEIGLEQAFSFYQDDYRDRISRQFYACANDGTPFDDVLRLVTARGNFAWIRVIGAAERNAKGEITAVHGALQDLTEMVRLNEQRSALREKLLDTVEGMSDGFVTLDADWCFNYVNSRAEALLQHSRKALLGKNLWEVFPEGVGSVFEREFRQARDTGTSSFFDAQYAPLRTWFRVTASPSGAELAVYFRDISEDRARAQKLRLLQSAVERMNDIVLITRAGEIDAPLGPRIVYANRAFERLTGFSVAEVAGQTPRILQGAETDRTELGRIRDALARCEPVRAELVNYSRDGRKYWVEIDVTPLTDDLGTATHFVSLQRDITARREAELQIRLDEERFRLIAGAMNDVIWDLDIHSGTIWWSNQLKAVFGYDPEGGFNIDDWRACIHPDDRARVQDSIAHFLSGDLAHWQDEYRFIRADGSIAYVSDRGSTICDPTGRAVRAVGAISDQTAAREAEAHIRQAQKLEAVGQLTGGVAHDFNNLLTVILGNAELLVDALEADSRLRSLAEMVASAAERGSELTGRLLTFARKQPLDPVLTDLNAQVRAILPLIQHSLGEAIKVKTALAKDLWLAEIDAGQLEAALLNLALNARDAMRAGGEVTIETTNVWLDAEAGGRLGIREGRYATVSVTDTGTGMPPELMERVLEPFFTTKGTGSGLGLPMVYGFVTQSGGYLKIRSEIGEGASVTLYFPQSASSAAAHNGRGAGTEFASGSEHILVVEDDPFVRQHVVAAVKSLGYKVSAAEDGPSALQFLTRPEAADLRLLFTDIVMPGGMNGRQLAEQATRLRPDLCVLYTSGYTENAITQQGRLEPGVHLLSKPYRRQDLSAKLRAVLDGVTDGSARKP